MCLQDSGFFLLLLQIFAITFLLTVLKYMIVYIIFYFFFNLDVVSISSLFFIHFSIASK